MSQRGCLMQAWSRKVNLVNLELRFFFQVTIIKMEEGKGGEGICSQCFSVVMVSHGIKLDKGIKRIKWC